MSVDADTRCTLQELAESQVEAGEKGEFIVNFIPVVEGSGIYTMVNSVESAVLGERADSLMGGSA